MGGFGSTLAGWLERGTTTSAPLIGHGRPPRLAAQFRDESRREEWAMTITAFDSERLEALRATFSGELLGAGDGAYEEVRSVHNALIDRRPVLIARCRSAADIAASIRAAADAGVEISVRGGGHNVAGRAVLDG